MPQFQPLIRINKGNTSHVWVAHTKCAVIYMEVFTMVSKGNKRCFGFAVVFVICVALTLPIMIYAADEVPDGIVRVYPWRYGTCDYHRDGAYEFSGITHRRTVRNLEEIRGWAGYRQFIVCNYWYRHDPDDKYSEMTCIDDSWQIELFERMFGGQLTVLYADAPANISVSALYPEGFPGPNFDRALFGRLLWPGSLFSYDVEYFTWFYGSELKNHFSDYGWSVTLNTPGVYLFRAAYAPIFIIVRDPAESSPAPDQTLPPTDEQPPANNQTPTFTSPPYSTDNGTLLEFTTTPNNRYGYRIFRATTATGDGISITDFPIMVNPLHSLNRIITFDPNVRPNRDYWYYVREVLEEARFDVATTTLIPEVLGPPSARVHVRTSAAITEPTAERGFIMMFIGNPHMNVNNVWEGIDPPANVTAPVINAGRTMVPIRAIVEAMGGSVAWTPQHSMIDLMSHGNHVRMWLGERGVWVNGSTNEMDVVPQVVNDRTLIPLRFVAEFLGAQVEWIGSQQMVVVVYELQ